ncbi:MULTISPECIES: serine/threonine-protein kinase [Pseudomonas]|nr:MULTISPECIES: serine/threonine-protein kinase [Pseudomonas]AZD86737.1 Serine/threonine protein kinase PpkA [Pseudomonas chlororaphis subsp. aureofaciens]AZD93289.1 Serine/threonine protein kinase PpkA [Pseudomonas chlororaphis subsp. aureofaciens]AZD99588.1 Serine/threonine protein kinase PpkA [Pseudomonas chlororaphis subsp. aureofaciens]AZE36785.1 Serine/threonine protein kinase PpkA [Pseudomonas chlororaphis subsp. aureofaciens]WDG51232.1 serine/threonine-protein kinase [Pseudomonas chlo
MDIPGYAIERELGEGAMATVYLATQRSLERKVALKVMAAALAADRSFCERFLREGKTLARLSHPHTVTIYDIGNVGHFYYMAMEYLPNGTLKERIAEGLSPQQGLVYLRQIALALGYAHAQGLVHRDVKPANILFRANGSAVLSDFGIAKSLEDHTQFTQAGFAVGTPSYMSPEQARGQQIDGRTDLYALGVVLYEILTGKLPYIGSDSLSTALAHLTEPLPELPIAHGRYQGILRKLLAKDPAERFADADALIAALDHLPPAGPADAEATQLRPLPLPATASAAGQSATTDLGGLAPVSLDMPPLAVPKPAPEPAPQPAATATATRAASLGAEPPAGSRGPLWALFGVVVAGVLALAGGGYWWLRPAPPVEPQNDQVEAKKTPAGDAQDSPAKTASAAQPPLATNADGGDRPLLMPGKKTLFQRVLSKPGAQVSGQPGAAPDGAALPAFSVLYVYQRKAVAGGNWLEVGAASDGQRDGWLPAEQVSDWKQSLVLKFTERSGRSPVMFLREESSLERFLADTAQARAALHKAQNEGSVDPQIVALEPVASAIPQDQFYLLPIFQARESFDANGQPVQLLNVASIDPGNTPQGKAEGAARAGSDAFRTAIVLVVDTSVSMQPYIDRVRKVVQALHQQIASRGDLDSVSFGLVGFRSNVEKTPGLEYVAQTLVSLEEGRDPQRFLELAGQVKAAQVSSHAFNEDAFAGVMAAVEGTDWSPYAGRLILLVTDAGALRKNDPLGRTQMNEAEVREAALSKQVKIYALHLRTEAGRKNHGFAEQQYRSLTADANPQIGDLYIPVAGGDVGRFGDTVAEIGSVFAEQVHQARNNQLPSLPPLQGTASVASKATAIGYAMQMDFLGRQSAVRAPQLITAWTSDHDLTNPSLPAFQVCVLLTKLQLNDLQQSLKLIVDAARRTQTSPKDFFQEIASASAHMSRDPTRLKQGGNLVEGGILGEYLDGLPYRSKSLSMTQDLWLSLSVAEQQDFIDELESKIRLYETFHNDIANWVRFGEAQPGDALYRVPLATLP